MSDGKETGNIITKNVAAFLLDKPIWVWWIFYVAVVVAFFGIFYFAFYLLSIQWWKILPACPTNSSISIFPNLNLKGVAASRVTLI